MNFKANFKRPTNYSNHWQNPPDFGYFHSKTDRIECRKTAVTYKLTTTNFVYKNNLQ